MSERRIPAAALWALGLTQIVGYGTLYYSFSILAPDMARELEWPEQWVFGALSVALLIGGLFAPIAGKWADGFGAGRIMTLGSAGAAVALVACAAAPDRSAFVLALVAMELASSFVLYSAAFVAIVQFGGSNAQRSITHLTLIAGFASTLFWPLTSAMHQSFSWREVYVAFAAMHLVLCLPIHAWIARLTRRAAVAAPSLAAITTATHERPIAVASQDRSIVFLLMLTGFAVEGFILSSILIHMVPLMAALGMGTAGLLVASLFGPAQVASRLINMLFGRGLRQVWLALIAATLLPLALIVLLTTNPSMPGAIVFAILFGLGSGLTSIVGGTLPLELFGLEGYGARLGWVTAARQVSSALAPFALALAMAGTGVTPSLWAMVALGAIGVATFSGIVLIRRRYESAAGDRAPAGSDARANLRL
ncbi:arsenite efflux MFS transporter ArsK [Sinorhizobium sp. 8-89]|uniref:arsenite efflux MFS transporter ArsK n=1 Tax=Sinorhizobium sp. 7-81 TaxID=3049087 RepID=UPI0024C2E75C|nr:arsenite efflux MFS transporter ArsK [Sinorhizobium sp. 7-81]MDK1386986.1 arsenite efflux MFS transporter ArsK [Sinorhizobium sp. 7-81]